MALSLIQLLTWSGRRGVKLTTNLRLHLHDSLPDVLNEDSDEFT
jgi:hypothetical protein